MKPEQRVFVELAQSLLRGTDLAIFFRAAPVVIFEWHARFLGQILQGLAEFKPLLLLNEGKDVATLITTKTMPGLRLREHIERRCALIMKRAESLEGLPRFMQSDNQTYLLHHIYFCFDCFDDRCHKTFNESLLAAVLRALLVFYPSHITSDVAESRAPGHRSAIFR